MPNAWVVVPTYNEADNIEDLVNQLLALPVDLGVIVVDDASPDGTGALADGLVSANDGRVRAIHRPGKLGLGTAYIAGFRRAFQEDAAHILTMDADFSHHPRYIPAMLGRSAQADLIVGSRYVPGGGTQNWPWHRRVLSRMANGVARAALGLKAHDVTAGFRCYRRQALETVPLDSILSHGYSFLVEMLFMVQRRGWSVDEVPIIFEDRQRGKSKISQVEIFKAVLTVLRLFWRRLFREPRSSPARPPAQDVAP
jgi:glycosyltransferase involved in cell wall biosynthesis